MSEFKERLVELAGAIVGLSMVLAVVWCSSYEKTPDVVYDSGVDVFTVDVVEEPLSIQDAVPWTSNTSDRPPCGCPDGGRAKPR